MKKLLVLSVALLTLASCNVKLGDNILPYIEGAYFYKEGGSMEFGVQSTGPWTTEITGDIEGLSLLPSEGTGSGNVLLIVPENTSDKARGSTIRFQCGKSYSDVIVAQSNTARPQ